MRWPGGAAVVATCLLLAAGRAAAVSDHLECYRIKDTLALQGVVDIAGSLGLEAGCKLRKAQLFCAPATKTVVAANVPQLPIAGQALSDGRICYKVSCPKRSLADRSVTDQFGNRVLRDFRAKLLCVPAVLGPPSSTLDGLDDLACYRMTNPQVVKAVVDLDAGPLGATSASLRSRGPFSSYCVGASTDIREVNVSPLLPIGGSGMDDDRLCYSIATPRPHPGDQVVSDRFGSRTLKGLVPKALCGPALSSWADPSLACQRAMEQGGSAYAQEVLEAIEGCAVAGQGESSSSCLGSSSARQRLAALRAQWRADAAAACTSTDLQRDLGYAETCGAAPSACTSASVGVDGVVDCLSCRIGEHLQGAAAKLYADSLTTGGCRGSLGSGIGVVRAALEQVHECVSQPGATSVAACFNPATAAWRAQAETSCAGVDPFVALGYPNLCSGNAPITPSWCSDHALPCTFGSTASLSSAGEDNDLLDCLTCQAEEGALGVARDLYGANLCCIDGACDTILTRFACREAGGTPVRYRVRSLATSGGVSGPHGIQVGPDGFLYLAQSGIAKVNLETGSVTSLLSSGWWTGVAVDPGGNLYLTDRCSHKIYKLAAGSSELSVIAGTGVPGHSGDEGPATAAQIFAPDGITIDDRGNVYFTESALLGWGVCGASGPATERIRMVDRSGIIHTVAGSGPYGTGGEGGPATAAQLALPYSLRVGVDGSLLIGENGAMRVLRVAGGTIERAAGRLQTPVGAHSGYGGPADRARFYHTCGLTGDLDANVVVGAMEDNRIALVDRLGSVTAIAGTGEGGAWGDANGDGGPASLARGFCCEDLTLGPDGRIYCSDLSINRIRVLTREPY